MLILPWHRFGCIGPPLIWRMMQNRYVADVGDYGKYALLRYLCRSDKFPSVSLAVVWCLFPDETFNNDGKHISYLRDPKFSKLDPCLHESLRLIISSNQREISSIAECGCLPQSTVFFSKPISRNALAMPAERVRYREAWLRECLCSTQNCDLVFFDPDNGLEIASVPKHHPKAGKYIFWSELARFWGRGDTLLVYHHLNRTAPAAQQIRSLRIRFAATFDQAIVVPLVFRRGSSRVFWLVHHGDALGLEMEHRTAELLSTGWSQHYRPLGWPGNDQATMPAG